MQTLLEVTTQYGKSCYKWPCLYAGQSSWNTSKGKTREWFKKI